MHVKPVCMHSCMHAGHCTVWSCMHVQWEGFHHTHTHTHTHQDVMQSDSAMDSGGFFEQLCISCSMSRLFHILGFYFLPSNLASISDAMCLDLQITHSDTRQQYNRTQSSSVEETQGASMYFPSRAKSINREEQYLLIKQFSRKYSRSHGNQSINRSIFECIINLYCHDWEL